MSDDNTTDEEKNVDEYIDGTKVSNEIPSPEEYYTKQERERILKILNDRIKKLGAFVVERGYIHGNEKRNELIELRAEIEKG